MKTTALFPTLLAIVCCLLLVPEARAQAITGYTSIDYDGSSNTVDAYSETDLDGDLVGDYSAKVSLTVVDQSSNLIASDSMVDMSYQGYAYVELLFSGAPDSSYTAVGAHKAVANLWGYDGCYYRSCILYWDNFNFSSFESQGIYQPWYYYFLSPGFQQFGRRSPVIGMGTTYDSDQVSTGGVTSVTVAVDPEEIRPNGTGGTVTATVTVSASPAASGRAVTLSAAAHNNGGHVGHTGTRPVGSFASSRGRTNSNGSFSTTYTASIFGGGVDITAKIGQVSGSKYLEVRVPSLGVIATGPDWNLVGQTTTHPDNHYGTATTNVGLAGIARVYNDQYYGVGLYPPDAEKLKYNDMSLVNGGKFDEESSNWCSGCAHSEHRLGLNCDVYSANVPTARWGFLTDTFVARGSPNYLDETGTLNHWHLRF